MKTTIFKKLSLALVCFVMLGLGACSKKNDGGVQPGTKGKTAKFTITVNGAPSSAYISFVMVGASTETSNNTIWKVNGVTRENEQGVSLGKNDFSGSTKTYVVESVTPLRLATVGIQCLSPDNASYTISYKAEIDGQVKNDSQNVAVTGNADFTHDYSY
ncbi:hypothetical protein D0C36_18720 [Mucilaginibacter conchicola]|uniref:Uncharacterized protein n=1 Tax=Mucilaginibacter conchicola TaxID=2303333 RepID=A0A372NQQ7_9SPHI|nr:hypothetical protein [Mucilaginibacter conchicola]RFZ90980.1 hypothetical protein D0C36_18720 [Mucilaginibacter conchicola]